MSLIIIVLLSKTLFAATPIISFEEKLHSEFQEKLSTIPFIIDNLHSSKQTPQYKLKRFDLDISISADFGVLIFSKEIEKSIELVWERKKSDSVADQNVHEVEIGLSADDTAKQMLPYVMEVLNELKASSRTRRKTVKKIYRDAKKLTRYVKSLQTFNGKEEWYVANYFKNYYFSVSGDLLGSGIEYDKRLRFRFRTPSPLAFSPTHSRFEQRIHRRLTRMARHFLEVQALDLPEHRFSMNRVRAVDGIEAGINFGLGEISLGRGILLEWLPSNKSNFISKIFTPYSPSYLRRLATTVETSVPDTKNFDLSQIRIKGSINNELSFLFLNFNKFREVEYHYRKKL